MRRRSIFGSAAAFAMVRGTSTGVKAAKVPPVTAASESAFVCPEESLPIVDGGKSRKSPHVVLGKRQVTDERREAKCAKTSGGLRELRAGRRKAAEATD